MAVTYLSRSWLLIKVCIRTYRLFFAPGTEDFYWRTRTPEEIAKLRETSAKRREQKKSALDAWLSNKIPSESSSSAVVVGEDAAKTTKTKTGEGEAKKAASADDVAAAAVADDVEDVEMADSATPAKKVAETP